jgi:hypothetical protein
MAPTPDVGVATAPATPDAVAPTAPTLNRPAVQTGPKLSRAAQLLSRLSGTRWFDLQTLAGELVVSAATVGAYLDGTLPMPLDRQLCLALFVIENVPPLARQGHQLHGQVQAAISFQARAAEGLSASPPRIRLG